MAELQCGTGSGFGIGKGTPIAPAMQTMQEWHATASTGFFGSRQTVLYKQLTMQRTLAKPV
jgi:hypothetical protein